MLNITNTEMSTHRKYEHVGPIKEGKMVNIDMLESNQTTDIHIKTCLYSHGE